MSEAATFDERRGVPSASGMERLVNCPPSHELAKFLPPEREDEAGKDAQRGTRIHLALSGDLPEAELNAADAETFDMCQRQAKTLAVEWGISEDFVAVRERRLGLTVLGRVIEATAKNKLAQFRFTGQADLILIVGDRALVIDYKTGRGDYADAVDNAQLASLAALVCLWRPVNHIRVAIVQPWVGPPTVADYDEAAMWKAVDWLHASLNKAEMATPADRQAGAWCKFCRVGKAGLCEVANGAALELVEVIEPESLATLPDDKQREAMFARAMELPAEKLAATMRGLAMVERFVAAIKGAAKQRAREDAEFQRFWTLREKKGRRSIADVRKVFERLAAHGVTAEAFTALCSIGLGDVKDLLRTATGSKGKALDSMAETALEGAVEMGAPSYELTQVEGGGIE
jgi:hypothetical protein